MNMKVWNLVFGVFLLTACEKDERIRKVQVRVSGVRQANFLKIVSHRHLNDDILAVAQPDSLGTYYFEFDLAQPLFASISPQEPIMEFLVHPGDSLSVTIKEKQVSVSGRGEGVLVSDQLVRMKDQCRLFKQNGDSYVPEKYIDNLSFDAFSNRLDSLKGMLNDSEAALVEKATISPNSLDLLARAKIVTLKAIQLEYLTFALNKLAMEAFNAKQNGSGDEIEVVIPAELSAIGEEIPIDTGLLNLGYLDYKGLLLMYLSNATFSTDVFTQGWETYRTQAPLAQQKKIESLVYPSLIREHLLTQNFINWAYQGHTPGIDSLRADFFRKYPNSIYCSAIDRTYRELLALAPGAPAPAFKGLDLKGNTIELSSLQGKVIYIDVWATWCGPCVEEFPFAKELHKKFESTDDVIFLNVSIDKNRETWSRFLKNGRAPGGLHIIIPENDVLNFVDSYRILGYPTYMILDRQGRIVDLNAPRPSSGKVEARLRELLSSTPQKL